MGDQFGTFNFRSINNQFRLQDWLIASANDPIVAAAPILGGLRFTLLLTFLVLFPQDFIQKIVIFFTDTLKRDVVCRSRIVGRSRNFWRTFIGKNRRTPGVGRITLVSDCFSILYNKSR